MRLLTPLEARVLGVLVEKQATVPDTYPLSLNALVVGCNQKTARDPVIEASDADAATALDGLKALALVFESSGGRVVRYEHNMARALQVPGAAVALLAALMLRGPQTAAELRLNCERLHRFADISSVEGFLDELAARTPPYALRLARAAGEREARWAHLLCGEPAAPASRTAHAGSAGGASTTADVSAGELAALKNEQTRLAAELDELKSLVQRLARELGVT
ncbi:MAG: YceH family protein [Burkholderiales bacterium]|nr:YceH family protein [Burkholderiales bacterium]